MKRILFVCLGNICRSPLAEAIFQDKVGNLEMESDSAGTAAYHIGENPDHRSVKVAQENNVPINHKARKFVPEDLDRFDYIIAMDQNNYDDMVGIAGRDSDKLLLLRSFDPFANGNLNVPDPYYGGYEGFENIFDIISRSVDPFIIHIQNESVK